jgi:hypothetical protein
MSPTDNVVTFPKRVPSFEPAPAAAEVAETPIPAADTQAAIDNLIGFLTENRAHIKCFVGGFICEDPPLPEGSFAFHSITSPIEPADYALALRMLEDSFERMLTSEPD